MISITRHPKLVLTTFLAASLVAGHAHASSEHGDLSVGSTADGGGDLMSEYNFETVLRTDFQIEVGPTAVYSSTTPGIGAAEDEAPDIFELDVGTTVEMTLITIDDNLAIQIDATTIDEPGESAVLGTHDGVPGDDGAMHQHPSYQVLLDAPKGAFGEGDFSFVFEDAGATYGASDIYSMHLTNGYLAPVEDATQDTAKCQKQVGKEVGKLISKNYKTIAKCLDAIQSWKADGGDPESDPAPPKVAKVCADPDKGIVPAVAANQAKALDKVVAKCVGTFGVDEDAATNALSPHLGMAACRVEELVGAAYSSALEDIAIVVFGDDEEMAEEAFPCIGESQGSTEPEEEE